MRRWAWDKTWQDLAKNPSKSCKIPPRCVMIKKLTMSIKSNFELSLDAKQLFWTKIAVSALGLVFLSLIGIKNNLDNQVAAQRVLTIRDRGEERTIVTRQPTLAAALDQAGYQLVSEDKLSLPAEQPLKQPVYEVAIERARPVLVVEGARRVRLNTAATSDQAMAAEAGIELSKYDVLEERLNPDSFDWPLEMHVKRAKEVKLNLFGNHQTLFTQVATVEELLKEQKVTWSSEMRLTEGVNQETAIVNGMELRVWREGRQEIEVEEDVPFKTVRTDNPDQPASWKEVTQVGKNGKRRVKYEIIIQDGQEVERRELASETLVEPVEQREIVGAKVEGPEEIIAKIRTAAAAKGIDAQRVLLIAQCESRFNPRADSGFYKGIFQHDPRYWNDRAEKYGFGGASYFDVDAQIGVSTSMMAGGDWSHWGCDPGPQ